MRPFPFQDRPASPDRDPSPPAAHRRPGSPALSVRARLAAMGAAAALNSAACANFEHLRNGIDTTPANLKLNDVPRQRASELPSLHAEILHDWDGWRTAGEREVEAVGMGLEHSGHHETANHLLALADSIHNARAAWRDWQNRPETLPTFQRCLQDVAGAEHRIRELPREDMRAILSALDHARQEATLSDEAVRQILRHILADNPGHYNPSGERHDGRVPLLAFTTRERSLLADYFNERYRNGYMAADAIASDIEARGSISSDTMDALYREIAGNGGLSRETWETVVARQTDLSEGQRSSAPTTIDLMLVDELLGHYALANGENRTVVVPVTIDDQTGGYRLPTTSATASRHGHHRRHHGH